MRNRIRAEQARTLFQQLPGIMILPNVAGVILAVMHYGHVATAPLLSWLTLNALVLGLGSYVVRYQYLKLVGDRLSIEQWWYRFHCLALASGIIWGAAPWFVFADGEFVLQMTLMIFLFTAAATVSQTMTASPLAYAAVTVPMLAGMAARLVIVDNSLHQWLALMTVIYCLGLSYFYWTGHKALMRSIELWFEKHNLALELEKREQTARLENVAKTRLMAMAGHDLRQPLRAQGLFLEQLGSALKDHDHQKLLAQLEECHWDLVRLFDGLMDVCRVDAGHLRTNVMPHPIAPLCERLAKRFGYSAQNKGLKLRIRSHAAVVDTDLFLLERILSNLLDNALTYTERGGVLLGYRQRGSWLRVDVVDTGNGIAEPQPQTPLRTYPNEAESSIDQGYGLGLSIVHRLATELGHKFEHRSTPGKGSRFSLYLPLSAQQSY